MIFPRINRSGAEYVDLVVTNVDASSITTGNAVVMALGGNSVNGANYVKGASGTAGNLPGFKGIAQMDFAANDVGRIRASGFANSILISHVGTSITINQGDVLIIGAGAGGMFSGTAPTFANAGFGFVIANSTPAAISAAGYVSGYVKCL
jgi:hypothetical protein